MADVHFILQTKGGVGKTFVAWNLIQYRKTKTKNTLPYDADPLNQGSSLSSYKALKVEPLKLLNIEKNIDKHQFDALMEKILSSSEDTDIFIDVGSSSFNPLISYLQENEAVPYLIDQGHNVYFHTILASGKELEDTTIGIAELIQTFNFKNIVVWVNPFWGKVEVDGKRFAETKFCQAHKDNILAIINLPEYSELVRRDVLEILKQALIYDELEKKGKGPLAQTMNQRRVLGFKKKIFELLDEAKL